MENLISDRLRFDVDKTTDVIGHTRTSRVITLNTGKTGSKARLVDGLGGLQMLCHMVGFALT
jgi:hypothetical protein